MSSVAIDVSILWPALIAGLLVTATHVPLGMQVLERGIVFIDLAVAQVAGVGVIFDAFASEGLLPFILGDVHAMEDDAGFFA